MKITSYSKILARSALISLLLATPVVAQSWIGSQPQTQVYISVVNVPSGKGVFVPAVWVENPFGGRTQVLMGEEGLTREILYNQAALIAWVLARGEYTNPKVIFDDRSGDKDTQNPTPTPTPEPTPTPTPTPEPTPEAPTEKTKELTKDDCKTVGGADVKTIDDLPIMLAKFTTPRASNGGAKVWAQPILVTVQPAVKLLDCLN